MPDKTPEAETPAELTAWAKGVAAAVTPAELARLVKDYREQARNSRRSETDREFAKRRGDALANFVKLTSERTKTALAAAKACGTKLGSARPGHWKGREHLRQAAIRKAVKVATVVRAKETDEAYRDLAPMMREHRNVGKSLQAIADELNVQGYETRRGKPWNPMQVHRVLQRDL